EAKIGRFIAGSRTRLEICTKLPPVDPDADVRAIVADAVEGSLARLGVERVDAYLVHRAADLRRHGRGLIDALAEQRARGRIERIGVSVYGPDDAALALTYEELTVVQHPLNLLDRRIVSSGVLDKLEARGVVTYARSVFLQGLLTLSPDELPERVVHARPTLGALRQLLSRWGVAPTDVALPFVASTAGVDRVVVGVETPEQLRANVAALERDVPVGLAAALDDLDVPLSVVDPTLWPEELK
ncbi:MAG: aldo/keto reductase, partial [Acidobacteriota bacterium]|nr:aldo/keto reductase [Acidobacteriota bacterium]